MTTVLNDRPNRSVENRQMVEAWKIKMIDKQRLKDSHQKTKKKKRRNGRGSWDEVEGGRRLYTEGDGKQQSFAVLF